MKLNLTGEFEFIMIDGNVYKAGLIEWNESSPIIIVFNIKTCVKNLQDSLSYLDTFGESAIDLVEILKRYDDTIELQVAYVFDPRTIKDVLAGKTSSSDGTPICMSKDGDPLELPRFDCFAVEASLNDDNCINITIIL